MSVCMYVCMYVCLYVCMYMYVCLSVRPSDEYQRLNYLVDWAQTAYRCQVGPGDGFRPGPSPIGR